MRVFLKKLKKTNEPLCALGWSFANDSLDVCRTINGLCNKKEVLKCSFYAVDKEDHPVGIVLGAEHEEYIEIRYIYVMSVYRKMGIGSKLLNKILDYSQKRCKAIQLYCHKELKDFYKKFGFMSNSDLIVMVRGL